jgi:hypothetical protein
VSPEASPHGYAWSMARQCPRCELRFLTDVEVRDHLILDHNMQPEQLELPYPLPGSQGPRARREAPPGDRIEAEGSDRGD